MKNRPYSWIFATVVVLVGLSIAVTGSVTAQSPRVVDVDANDLEGSGTAADPYEITNASELQAMEDDLDAHYELGSDIDASTTAQWNNQAGFDPIGDGSEEFSGYFDGNQHTITGLTINRGSSAEEVGLFGEVDSALIESVHLESVTISGNNSVGALAGYLEEDVTIQNASVNGSVSGTTETGGLIGSNTDSTVKRASAKGTVTGSDSVGGLVGQNLGGVVTQASSNAAVTATGEEQGGDSARGGGLVGGNFNDGIINKSYATGNVTGGKAGGITGENYDGSRVANTYAAGHVDGRSDRNSGGVSGDNIGSCPFVNEQQCEGFEASTITDSYWDTKATGQSASEGDAVGLTTSEMTGSAAETNMAEFAFGSIWQTQPNGYPTLITLPSKSEDGEDGDSQDSTTGFVDVDAEELAGGGTSDNPYVITNASELQAMEDNQSAYYELGSDIDASQTARWNNGKGFNPIRFSGSFNGNNYTITNLTIDRRSKVIVGLFKTNLGKVTNVTIRKFRMTGRVVGAVVAVNNGTITDITAQGSITGDNGIGAIVGHNRRGGTLVNTEAQVDIQAGLPEFSPYGPITDNSSVGGLVGYNQYGTIKRSSATGTITASSITGVGGLVGGTSGGVIANSSTTTKITGKNYVGGFVGSSDGDIIRDAYAAGSVSGSTKTGGFVGVVRSSAISDSYWDTEVTGKSTSAGDAVGLTTAEMTGSTARSSMSALDFDTVWNTQAGGYPILAQQADDKSKQSGSAQVQLSNVSLTPQSVDLDSESTHKLTFDAYNVSNDGEKDEFEIEFPNRLNLIDSSDITVSGISSTPQVNITGNTLRFTVNPSGTQSTRTLTVKMNITLSASDTKEEVNNSSSKLPIPSDAEKVEITAQEREGLRSSLEGGGEIDVENITQLSVYSANLQRDTESGGFVWFQKHKNVGQWEQNGTTGNAVLYKNEDTALYIGVFDGKPFDDTQNPQRDQFYIIKGPWDGLFV